MISIDPRHWLWGPLSRLGLSVALVTFMLDQAHKWWMLLGFDIRGKGRVTVTPFLDFVYVLNQGVSYSFLTGSNQRWQYVLAVFALLAAVTLAIWVARGVDNRLTAISAGLIIGGALGNGLDRLTLGGVADFFSLHAFGYYWYVFNIADVAIVAGVVGLLYESVSPSKSLSSGATAAAETSADATKRTQSGR